mgnify:CR=1 FL=1
MKFEDFEIKHENDNTVTFVDEAGNEELYQIIFTLESKVSDKKYAIFVKLADIQSSDDDQIDVGAAEIKIDDKGNARLEQIETDEEWEIVQQGIQKFDEEFEEIDFEDEEDSLCKNCDHKQCYLDEKNSEICECDGNCKKDKE